jgi:hypothetical protein
LLRQAVAVPTIPFLDLPAEEIAIRIRTVASAAAGAPVEVRVGDEATGFRNVGVDLPKGRRPAVERRALLRKLHAVLEKMHVTMAPNALAPLVKGDLRGQVQVRRVSVNGGGDASHLGHLR